MFILPPVEFQPKHISALHRLELFQFIYHNSMLIPIHIQEQYQVQLSHRLRGLVEGGEDSESGDLQLRTMDGTFELFYLIYSRPVHHRQSGPMDVTFPM